MKIATMDAVHDGSEVPVAVILTPEDRANIARMPPSATIYCQFPGGLEAEPVMRWVNELKPGDDPMILETRLDENGKITAEPHVVSAEEQARRLQLWRESQ